MNKIAAIVFVTVLAHLVLMTSGASADDLHVMSQDASASPHLMHIDAMNDPSCFTIEPVVQSTRILLQAADQATPPVNRMVDDHSVSREYATPPPRPPGIARALLQIYLI